MMTGFRGGMWRDAAFKQGVKDMLAVTPGVCAWGLVTGVAMVKSGLDLHVVVAMSVLVFAASAQLAALPLMLGGAPMWVVWLAATAVNLRFVVFSAQMRRYMTPLPWPRRLIAGYLTADMTFALMHRRYAGVTSERLSEHTPLSYFAGLSSVNWLTWNLSALVGIAMADQIPMDWGLELAGALALLGLPATLMNDWTKMVIGATASVIAFLCHDWPFKSGIVLALPASITLGYTLERLSADLTTHSHE